MTALFGLSILARLPLAMLSIGLLVHTQAATGSTPRPVWSPVPSRSRRASAVPLLGRAADRRGQSARAGRGGPTLRDRADRDERAPPRRPGRPARRARRRGRRGHAARRRLLPRAAASSLTTRPAQRSTPRTRPRSRSPGSPARRVVLALGAAVSTGAALAAIGVLLAASTLAFAASKASRSLAPRAARGRGTAPCAPPACAR